MTDQETERQSDHQRRVALFLADRDAREAREAIAGITKMVAGLGRLVASIVEELHAIPRPSGITIDNGVPTVHLREVTGENREDEPDGRPGIYKKADYPDPPYTIT